jgi:predicted peptidase
MRQQARSFQKRIAKTVAYRYWLFLPAGYRKDGKRWPLMLFLHGSGERGDDLELVKKHGPPKLIEAGHEFPFIVLAPQCPAEEWWDPEGLDALLDSVIAKHQVDEHRVYLTGMSMGGYGAWALAGLNPGRFAAVAPVCGGLEPRLSDRLKTVPVWAFHGAKDKTVPVGKSAAIVKALRQCGGDVRFTIYPRAGHDSWTRTYENPKLYEWLLKHRKGQS